VVGGNQKRPEINIGDLTLIWMISQLRDLMGIDEKQLTKILSTSEPGAKSIADSKKGTAGLGFEHLRGRYVGLGDRDFVHQSVRLFTPLTNITEIGPILPKILAGKATKVVGGYSWKTSEGKRTVKEDKPNPFEAAKLKKIKVYIEGSGAAFLAAEGDKPLEPAGEDEDLEEKVPVDEKPSKKTPSGKRLKKTPAASTARGAADNPKAPPIRPHKKEKEVIEPAGEDEDLEEEVPVDEKPSKKTTSGKRLKKTPAASTARGAADNPKAPPLRPHKEEK